MRDYMKNYSHFRNFNNTLEIFSDAANANLANANPANANLCICIRIRKKN
jgi:hypothetical protein